MLQRRQLIEVGALQSAVFGNVGEDQHLYTHLLHLARQIEIGYLRHIQPTFGGDHAVQRVDADRDAMTVFRHRPAHQLRVFQRRRAENAAGNAFLKIRFQRVHIADTAAHLNLESGFAGDRFKNILILAAAGFGTVQIHHMDPLRTRLFKRAGGRQRVLRHTVHRVKIAFDQPHTLPVFDINCGKNDHRAPP